MTTGTTPPLPPTSNVNFDDVLKDIAQANGLMTTAPSGIQLTLFKDFVEVILSDNVTRQISYEGLKELLDRSLDVKETVISISGMTLPSNVFFLNQTASELRFSCYYPGGNRSMIFNTDEMNIVTPNIIISFTLRLDGSDWIVKEATYMCTDLPISKLPRTFIKAPYSAPGVYLLPMSNTYPEGNMCYGGNAMPARFKDNNLRGLDWYFRFLWETPFNSDLGIKAISNAADPENWYKLLASFAKDNKTFPYRDLNKWVELEGAVPSTSALKKSSN